MENIWNGVYTISAGECDGGGVVLITRDSFAKIKEISEKIASEHTRDDEPGSPFIGKKIYRYSWLSIEAFTPEGDPFPVGHFHNNSGTWKWFLDPTDNQACLDYLQEKTFFTRAQRLAFEKIFRKL